MTRPKKPSASKVIDVTKPNKNRDVADMFRQQRALRKRTLVPSDDNATDNDDDQLASDDDDSDNNAESDDSDVQVSSSKRRRTSKRSGLSSKSQPQHRRKRGANSNTNTPVTEVSLTHSSQLLEPVSLDGSENLYDKVASAAGDVEEITTSWVDSYRADDQEALRYLINFLIRSCGCMTAVTEDAFTKEDIAVEVLKELEAELAKLPQPEYPIISKSKAGRDLKRNILSFFENLLEQCQHNIIYDGTFIETLQTWLTVMSSSVYRPFRHTATILTFKIMESLCSFANKINSTLFVTQRQLATEEAKSNRARNQEKKRILRQRAQNAERKKTELDGCISEFFEGSRDVENVIRTECIKELCSWMLNYASHFVENQYLRYFGWALNDLNPHVRSEALKAVSRLYRVESTVEKLSDFIERFKARIQEMALYDVDLSVKLHAIDLCNTMFKENHDIFDEENQLVLMNLIFVDNERIQRSVAPFVRAVLETKLLSPMVDEVQDALRSMSVNEASNVTQNTAVQKSWVSFKCIAGFIVKHLDADNATNTQSSSLDINEVSIKDAENDSVIARAIEALWSQLAVLHDYKAMADYLCRDHSTSQQEGSMEINHCYRLTEQEEMVLISVFVTCLKLLTGRGIDMSEGHTKKKLQDDLLLVENRTNVSSYLVPILSRLLTKHNDSPGKMVKLVAIPQLMNLDVYSDLRMNPTYEEHLQILTRVYLGATEPSLLENCAKSLHQMQNANLLSDVTGKLIPELTENVTAQIRDACAGKDITIAKLSREEKFSITINLLRLDNLINHMDITDAMEESENANDDLIDLMGSFVDRSLAGDKDEEQMSLSVISILFRYLTWKCDRIWSDPELDGPGRVALGRMERRRDWIFTKLIDLATLPDVTPVPIVRSTAFGILMDLYWIFSSELFSGNTELGVLQLDCPEAIQTRCKNYITSELEKWRNLLNEKEAEDDSQMDGEDEEGGGTRARKTESDGHGILLVANVARAVAAHVLRYEHATSILAQYGHLDTEADEIMKAFIENLKDDLLYDEEEASKICQMFLGALKESFETYVNQSHRSIDKTLSLARQMNRVIALADQEDPARHVSDQVICDRIHIDGITFAFSKIAEYKEHRKSDAVCVPLKFFRVLSTLAKPLNRARDAAKIHKHIDNCLTRHQLTVEQNDKDWEGYHAYVKSIDEILKRKGLRQASEESTRRHDCTLIPGKRAAATSPNIARARSNSGARFFLTTWRGDSNNARCLCRNASDGGVVFDKTDHDAPDEQAPTDKFEQCKTDFRTLLFLQFRNSYARSGHHHPMAASSETQGLMESSDSVIEMSVLPPQWVDIVEEVDEALDQIKDKINRLQGMHRKHLLPGFDDRSSDEAAIENLTTEITNEFYRIKQDIQKVGRSSSTGAEDRIAQNIRTSLATKVQEEKSLTYLILEMQGQENRKANILGLETNLSNDAAELLLDEDAQLGFTESQLAVLENNEAIISQREREVNQIAKSIHQLAEIFRDLQTMVIDQGTMLDRIDYNIEQTTVQVKQATGAKYQSKTRRRKLILLLILVIFLLIMILIAKAHKS
ncbi:hypothetical protein BX666DRAFT_2025903 [Dichotomocladium elegans]|nr:hypothetical protein BX666DRAFT_2025903 [Dichotomocladium elegans]